MGGGVVDPVLPDVVPELVPVPVPLFRFFLCLWLLPLVPVWLPVPVSPLCMPRSDEPCVPDVEPEVPDCFEAPDCPEVPVDPVCANVNGTSAALSAAVRKNFFIYTSLRPFDASVGAAATLKNAVSHRCRSFVERCGTKG